MGWGAEIIDPAAGSLGPALTGIDDITEQFTSAVTLKTGEVLDVQVLVDNEAGSVTDSLILTVYKTIDGGITWEKTGARRYLTPTGVSPEAFHFPVLSAEGIKEFRLGFLSGGSTDTYAATPSHASNGRDA